jgi:tetratricopeptide (TPR) repeat protein
MGLWTALPSPAGAAVDRIRLTRGSESGEVVSMTPLELTLSKGATAPRLVPVNEITSLIFADEPSELTQARINAQNGGYINALETLDKIKPAEIERDFIKQDIEFYKAISAAKLALGGSGSIGDAGRRLNEFVRTYPKSFHRLEAVEVLGDLLVATGNFSAAERQYDELAQTPWPEYQTRAHILWGRALQTQDKHAEAVDEFDIALALVGDTKANKSPRLTATLGKAVSLVETGKVDEGVRMVEQVIRDGDPEDHELQAGAHNALGNCYRRAGKTQDALMAYLYVDVLCSNVPEAHAEALHYLVPLWQETGHEAQSREARQLLQDRYGASPWAK